MDHLSAETRAEELRREHPDRLTHTWMARGNPDGEWEVVKVRLPAIVRATSARSPPEPPPERSPPPSGAA